MVGAVSGEEKDTMSAPAAALPMPRSRGGAKLNHAVVLLKICSRLPCMKALVKALRAGAGAGCVRAGQMGRLPGNHSTCGCRVDLSWESQQ